MAQVDLGEDCGTMEAIEELVDAGKGVAVLDSDVVQTTVIDAEAEGAILFTDEQDGGAIGGGARANVVAGEERDELTLEIRKFVLRHGVDGAVGWRGAWGEFDLVVDGAGGGKGQFGCGGRESGGELG